MTLLGRWVWVVALVTGTALTGCGGASSASSTVETSKPVEVPTAAPSARATPSPVPSPMPVPTQRPAGFPPDGLLGVEGGDLVPGDIGSFTWQNAGSDSPALPGEPISVGHGETLSLTLAPEVAIETWTAAMERYPLSVSPTLPMPLGQGRGDEVSFISPPRGSWSVHISVWFAGNLGQASYYWQVTVE